MRPRMQILGSALVERVLDESFAVLEKTGMRIEDDAARERLVGLGLRPRQDSWLTFPRPLVEQALKTAPSSVNLFDRDGRPYADVGGDNVHFVPASSALRIQDWRTGEIRDGNTDDFGEYVRLADQLPNLGYLSTAFIPKDIPQEFSDAWRQYLILSYSKKPFVSGAFTAWGVPRMADIQQLFRDDAEDLAKRPMSIFTICPNTPLRWGEDPIHNLLDCADRGIPVEIVPVLLLGMISPATTVGSLVLHTVEVLSGLTIAQLVRPGTPVLFGGAPATFHMRYMTNPMTAVEALQLFCGYADLAHHLGLPSQGYMGLSDSKHHDPQAGAESGSGMMLAGLCRMNSVSGPGMLDYVNCFSLDKLVFDDEIAAYVHRFLQPVEEKEDLPVADLFETLIEENHLLAHEHTLEYWPEEFLLPGPVWDRTNWEQWEQQGERDIAERCRERLEELVDDAEPDTLDAATHAEIRRLMNTDAVLPEVDGHT